MRHLAAGGTLSTWLRCARLASLAEHSLYEGAGQRHLADPLWTMQQVGMARLPTDKRAFEDGLRLFIADDAAH